MLQQKTPEDYVISTGNLHSVREFVELSFKEVGISIFWEGNGVNEKGLNSETGDVLVEINPNFFRTKDSSKLCGDSNQAIEKLNCNPNKTNFEDIVKEMVCDELKNKS